MAKITESRQKQREFKNDEKNKTERMRRREK